MRIVARGRDDVLLHLEDHANSKCGEPGEYMLVETDSGSTVLIIAGQVFSGDFDGKDYLPITTKSGIVVGWDDSKLA